MGNMTKSKKTVKVVQTAQDISQHAGEVSGLGADFEARRIYLFGEICDEIAYRFLTNFHTMDAYKAPIRIVLSSNGGGDGDGGAIYDAIRMSNNDVTIIGTGSVYSIAALIFQSAKLRLLTPECRFMIHNGSLEIGESIDANKLVVMSKEVKYSNDRFQRILSARSGISLKKIEKFCKNETFFSAEEACRLGFADGVLDYDGNMKEIE